jgi:hypothetical protein
MQVAEVEALAARLRYGALDIDDIRQYLTAALERTAWEGADRRRFEAEWFGQCAPLLRRVADLLEDAARAAHLQAREQRSASEL